MVMCSARVLGRSTLAGLADDFLFLMIITILLIAHGVDKAVHVKLKFGVTMD